MPKRFCAKRGALAAMFAAALLLLGGCSQQLEERAPADMSQYEMTGQMPAPQADDIADSETTVLLYFLSEDGSHLAPVSRKIAVPGGVSPMRAALGALLAGPLEGESGAWPDLGLPLVAQSMEVSAGVAIVNLPARVRTLPQETLYAVRRAIANTLTEFAPVEHVSVLVGGREEGFDLAATLPVGALTRSADMNIAADYDRLEQMRQEAQSFTQATVIYMPTSDGRFVLPQVRNVDYAQMNPIEYLYTLLEEMGEGNGGELFSRSVPAPMMFIDEMPEIVRTDDGAYRAIEIQFEAALDEALASAGLTRGVYMAMLTHTLMSAVPGVEGLKVHIGDEVLTSLAAKDTPEGKHVVFAQTLATRDDFAAYIGAPVTVYAIDDHSTGLVAGQRVIAQARSGEPRALLEMLLAMWSDRSSLAALSGADILAVAAEGDEFSVNLSAGFASALRGLSGAEARCAVYAMVNTLTQQTHAGGVSFYFEGEQMAEPLGGLEMRGRFARNPGMVVD